MNALKSSVQKATAMAVVVVSNTGLVYNAINAAKDRTEQVACLDVCKATDKKREILLRGENTELVTFIMAQAKSQISLQQKYDDTSKFVTERKKELDMLTEQRKSSGQNAKHFFWSEVKDILIASTFGAVGMVTSIAFFLPAKRPKEFN
jgi:hypothetical protein